MTALCQIWTGYILISELAESQRNRSVRKTRSASGTIEAGDQEIGRESKTSL